MGKGRVMPSSRAINITLLVIFVGALVVYYTQRHLYYERLSPELEPANHVYLPGTEVDDCTDLPSTKAIGDANNLETVGGTSFSIRVPANYQADVPHPLLVVYAPGGRERTASERLVSITAAATSAGFIVAFADDRSLSVETILDLGTIPDLVGERWCLDPDRIFLTGHSNGGTVANALAFLEETPVLVRGIAPSAAGISGADFAARECPAPLSVMVMHSAEDRLFPGFGAQAARWWASCNRCDVARVSELANGCLAYLDCAPGVQTVYCEGSGAHTRWPALNSEMLDFFLNIGGE